jgi:hypothetical protein
MKTPRGASLLAAAAFVAVALGAVAAGANPSATKITVYQAPCGSDMCTSHDRALTSGAVVDGTIQIQATSTTQVGFDWIHLEAKTGSTWTCLASWTPTSTSFWAQVDWDTTAWPSCNAAAGQLTPNTSVTLRLDAHEKVGNGETVTAPFVVKLNNRAQPPVWARAPSATSGDDANVVLRWKANPEPDVAEYHFVRDDPDGSEQEFAVSASAPGGQGCDFDGTTYECTDDSFAPRGYSGQYHYILLAFRTSPSSSAKCALPPNAACTESATSAVQSAKLVEPKDTTAGASGPSARPTSRPRPTVVIVGGSRSRSSGGSNPYYKDLGELPGSESASDGSTLPYSDQLPYGGAPAPAKSTDTQIVASGADGLGAQQGESGGGPWRPIAAGLVLMLVGVHLTRLLRAD